VFATGASLGCRYCLHPQSLSAGLGLVKRSVALFPFADRMPSWKRPGLRRCSAGIESSYLAYTGLRTPWRNAYALQRGLYALGAPMAGCLAQSASLAYGLSLILPWLASCSLSVDDSVRLFTKPFFASRALAFPLFSAACADISVHYPQTLCFHWSATAHISRYMERQV